MTNHKYRIFIYSGLAILLVAVVLLLYPTADAQAQCGSQASSCKNCHEVQGEDPVNSDGTAWHPSHAFGDFCYICHAGNQQATDKDAAHEGMVSPLQDVKASCQQCHPDDLQERAQVYASALGVEIGTSTSTSASEPPTAGNEAASPTAVVSAQTSTEMEVYDPNLVDYEETYNEIVLGKKPINWGNVILVGLIGLLVVGGGGFVIIHEKLVKVSFSDTKKVEGEYPAEVVDFLPAIEGLKSQSRKSLKKLLDNPRKTEKVLGLMEAIVSNENTEE